MPDADRERLPVQRLSFRVGVSLIQEQREVIETLGHDLRRITEESFPNAECLAEEWFGSGVFAATLIQPGETIERLGGGVVRVSEQPPALRQRILEQGLRL